MREVIDQRRTGDVLIAGEAVRPAAGLLQKVWIGTNDAGPTQA
jgi:hypothetical protein